MSDVPIIDEVHAIENNIGLSTGVSGADFEGSVSFSGWRGSIESINEIN